MILSATSTIENLRRSVGDYHEALREMGTEPRQRSLAVNRVTHVVESGAAKEVAERFFSEGFLAAYDRWGNSNVTVLGSEDRVDAVTSREHFILGEPSECIERLHELAEIGIHEVRCLMNFAKPDLDSVNRSIHLFAERVAPFVSDG